jgi:hypothetical protein
MASGQGGYKFETVDDLQGAIDKYFADCDKGEIVEVYCKKAKELVTYIEREPYTVTGLALALGGTSRKQLCKWENGEVEHHDKEAIAKAVKIAKLRCENYCEKKALKGEGNAAGAIFCLKNYGWKDRQDVEGDMTLNIIRKSYGRDNS